MATAQPKGPRARARRHDWVDERSRALHAAVAEKLRRDPSLVRVAFENLARWERGAGSHARPALEEWRRLLTDEPLERVLALLTGDSDEAAALRQNAPFAGVLSPEERAAILSRYERL